LYTVIQPRHPLRINVGFLHHASIGTFREIHFVYPALRLSPDFELNDFSGMVRLNRTPQGILFQGEFSGRTSQLCVRCLADFVQPLKINFDELYAFDERSVSDSGLILPEDGNVDLDELVREYMLLEIPIKPLCRLDCKGLCAECGVELNNETCEHVGADAASVQAEDHF
jgi:uncharacterized protein